MADEALGKAKGERGSSSEEESDEAGPRRAFAVGAEGNGCRQRRPAQRCSACGSPPETAGLLQDCPGATEQALCVRCCFRAMDPFRPVVESDHIVHMCEVESARCHFSVDAPGLREWRKGGQEIEVRMLRRPVAGSDVSESKPRHPLHQTWPRIFVLSVNDREVLSVKPAKGGKKRRDLPHNISANLRRGANCFDIFVEDLQRGDFVLAVVRVTPRKPRDMAKHVVPGDTEECLARIRSLLASRSSRDVDPEEAGGVECVGDERLQLRCPITLERPASTPVRGELCRHLQCLDLDAFLVSNYRMKAFNSRWRCPICSLELRPQDLCVDTFVQEVLAGTPSAVEEVFVNTLGDWRVDDSAIKDAGPAASDSEENGASHSGGSHKKVVDRCIVDDANDEAEAPSCSAVAGPRELPRKRALPPEAVNGHPPEDRRRSGHAARKPARPPKASHRERHGGGSGKRAHKERSRQCAGKLGSQAAGHPRHAVGGGLLRPAPRIPVVRKVRRQVAPPRNAIAVDSDAPPESVSDSGEAPDRGAPAGPGAAPEAADCGGADSGGAGDDGGQRSL